MTEITYEELMANLDRYFQSVADGAHITVSKNGVKIILLQSIDYSILREALQIAQLVMKDQ